MKNALIGAPILGAAIIVPGAVEVTKGVDEAPGIIEEVAVCPEEGEAVSVQVCV